MARESRQSAAAEIRAFGNTLTSDANRNAATPAEVPEKSDNRSQASLEKLQADDEVFFRIVADALDQLLRLIHGLVGVVVERAVLHELSDGALAFIDAGQDVIEARDGVIQLFRKFGVFGQLADRSLSRVDVGQKLVGIGDGGIQILVQRVVLDQLAGCALTALDAGSDLVEACRLRNWHGCRACRH